MWRAVGRSGGRGEGEGEKMWAVFGARLSYGGHRAELLLPTPLRDWRPNTTPHTQQQLPRTCIPYDASTTARTATVRTCA